MNAEGYMHFEEDLLKVKDATENEDAKKMLDLAVDLLHNCRDIGLKGLCESDALSRVKNLQDCVEAFNKDYAA